MGPYCKFCNNRCFVHFPNETPNYILKAYGPNTNIIATCLRGQKFEKEKIGYCYDDIQAILSLREPKTVTYKGFHIIENETIEELIAEMILLLGG